MADITTANSMVELYIKAEKNILQGKTVSINGKSYSYENLAEIRAGRQEWEKVVSQLSSNRRGPRARRIIPLDI